MTNKIITTILFLPQSVCLLAKYHINHWMSFNETCRALLIDLQLITFGANLIQDGRHKQRTQENTKTSKNKNNSVSFTD